MFDSRITAKIVATSILAVASGCVARPPLAFPPPAPAACCKSWQDARFEPVGIEGASHVAIHIGQSATFDFTEGRSTFVAYMLPEQRPRSIGVRTFVSTPSRLPYATVFRPRVLFLDAGRREIATRPFEPMTRGAEFLAGPYYTATADVPPEARYVVIYAAPSAKTDRLVARSVNGSIFGLPNAYEGTISVTFQ
ncbi:hypothetical protein [Burkholderia sp. S-53]|uniref:hypothetical protein n=1 Tax=Burkholderia sp. S-53 TaxID=2906514 RepID=UPI0021CEBF28|nr:hypothetical protein [Burkholderia sp. S-53]UXU90941.1 hypothetical protein LXM88_22440 [Burkholderia sp. S-53]